MHQDKIPTGASIIAAYENTTAMNAWYKNTKGLKSTEAYAILQRDLVSITKLPGDTSGITKVMSVFDGIGDLDLSYVAPGDADAVQLARANDVVEMKKKIVNGFFGVNTTPPASGVGFNYPSNRGLAIQVSGIANVLNTWNDIIEVNDSLFVDLEPVSSNNCSERWKLQFKKATAVDEIARRRAISMSTAGPGDVYQVRLVA